jgi:methylamine dehydrogenase accessory protein MauD
MTIIALATAFWVSYVMLWCVVALFGLLILLMYRQFGLAFMGKAERIGMQGLDVGSRAPSFSLVDKNGHEQHVAFGRESPDSRPTVVLFAMPECQVCARLVETLPTQPSKQPDVRFVWVDGSSPSPTHATIDGAWVSGSVPDDPVHRRWEVSAVPFGFVVASNGRIADKRLINRREDIEAALAVVGVAPKSAAKPHTVNF